MSVPDDGYSRNHACTFNWISTFFIKAQHDVHVVIFNKNMHFIYEKVLRMLSVNVVFQEK